MLIAQRDDVTARISGGIDVIGNLFTDALISGRLTNDFIEVRLVDAFLKRRGDSGSRGSRWRARRAGRGAV